MLKFFRKIRQQLLSEHKFSKYLLYAIGEITLVVLGILIALQINTWNENFKNLKSQVNILQQLKSDIQENLTEVKQLQRSNYRHLITGKKYLEHLTTNSAPQDSMKLWMYLTQGRNIANFNKSTFQNMQSKGAISLRNDSLRIKISEIYDLHLHNVSKRMELEQKAYDRFQDLIGKRMKRDTIVLSDQEFTNIISPIDINQLRRDNEFQNALFMLNSMRKIRDNRIPQSVQALEEIIEAIDLEIKHLKREF